MAWPGFTVKVGTTGAYTTLAAGTRIKGWEYARKSHVVEVPLADGGVETADGMLRAGEVTIESPDLWGVDFYAVNTAVETFINAIEAQIGKFVVVQDDTHTGTPLVMGFLYDRVLLAAVEYPDNALMCVGRVKVTVARTSAPAEALPVVVP